MATQQKLLSEKRKSPPPKSTEKFERNEIRRSSSGEMHPEYCAVLKKVPSNINVHEIE